MPETSKDPADTLLDHMVPTISENGNTIWHDPDTGLVLDNAIMSELLQQLQQSSSNKIPTTNADTNPTTNTDNKLQHWEWTQPETTRPEILHLGTENTKLEIEKFLIELGIVDSAGNAGQDSLTVIDPNQKDQQAGGDRFFVPISESQAMVGVWNEKEQVAVSMVMTIDVDTGKVTFASVTSEPADTPPVPEFKPNTSPAPEFKPDAPVASQAPAIDPIPSAPSTPAEDEPTRPWISAPESTPSAKSTEVPAVQPDEQVPSKPEHVAMGVQAVPSSAPAKPVQTGTTQRPVNPVNPSPAPNQPPVAMGSEETLPSDALPAIAPQPSDETAGWAESGPLQTVAQDLEPQAQILALPQAEYPTEALLNAQIEPLIEAPGMSTSQQWEHETHLAPIDNDGTYISNFMHSSTVGMVLITVWSGVGGSALLYWILRNINVRYVFQLLGNRRAAGIGGTEDIGATDGTRRKKKLFFRK